MRWVLEHLQVLIVIAGAIAYYVNQRRREKEGLPPEDEEGSYDPAQMEAEEAERTRRLQEELRRKREQREAGEATAQPRPPVQTIPAPLGRRETTTPPVYQDPLSEMMRDLARRMAPQPVPVPVPEAEQAILEHQHEMERKLYALDVERQATLQRADDFRRASILLEEAPPPKRVDWTSNLRNPQELRRAIVLNEILGKPVGLR